MPKLDLLSVALGLATLAGVNLYLTVFATGLAIHFHWITLAPQYQSLEILGHPLVIIISGILYLLEFLADKSRGSIRPGTRYILLFTQSEKHFWQFRGSCIRGRALR